MHWVRVSYWIHAQIHWVSLILKSSAFQLSSSFFYLFELPKQVLFCWCLRVKLLDRMDAWIFVWLKFSCLFSKDDVHFVRTDCFDVRRRLIGDCLNCLKFSIHTIFSVATAISKVFFILEIWNHWIDLVLMGNLLKRNHFGRLLSLTVGQRCNCNAGWVGETEFEDLMRVLMARAIRGFHLGFIVHNIVFYLIFDILQHYHSCN